MHAHKNQALRNKEASLNTCFNFVEIKIVNETPNPQQNAVQFLQSTSLTEPNACL